MIDRRCCGYIELNLLLVHRAHVHSKALSNITPYQSPECSLAVELAIFIQSIIYSLLRFEVSNDSLIL